jgi:hypothetical protein
LRVEDRRSRAPVVGEEEIAYLAPRRTAKTGRPEADVSKRLLNDRVR